MEDKFIEWCIKYKWVLSIGGFFTLGIGIGVILLILGIIGFVKSNQELSKENKNEKIKESEVVGMSNKNLNKIEQFIKDEVFEDEKIKYLVDGESKNNSFMTLGVDKMIGGGDHLIVTNERILIIKRGASKFFSGSTGIQAKSFYYNDITTIDTSSLLGRYFLEITVPGLTHKQGGIERFTSENVFEYTKGLNEDMIKVRKEIQKRIREFKKKR